MVRVVPAAAQSQPAPWAPPPQTGTLPPPPPGAAAAPMDNEVAGSAAPVPVFAGPTDYLAVRATTDYLSPRAGTVPMHFQSPSRVLTVAVALDDPSPQRPIAPDRRQRRDLCQTPCVLYLDPRAHFDVITHADGVVGWYARILVPEGGGRVALRAPGAIYTVGGVAFLAGFAAILVGIFIWAAPQQWWGRGLPVQQYTEAGAAVLLTGVGVLGLGIAGIVGGRGVVSVTPGRVAHSGSRFRFSAAVAPIEGGAITAAMFSF